MLSFIFGGGIILILGPIFHAGAGKYSFQDKNRTCIPAEAEPILNSSSCYPLVNFTRPYCENQGITLPNYVYMTPQNQSKSNFYANKDRKSFYKLRKAKIISFFSLDLSKLENCMHIFDLFRCHFFFPRCDRTQSVYKEQKVCRETCLKARKTCYKLWKFIEAMVVRLHRDKASIIKETFRCERQPYRNAGDSPECWYDDLTNSTDESSNPNWTANLDCLYLNGSSYHGNISVTASGIPCQSWIEQCPHRHTMNTTYPELNNAKNYCRNPKNSGQRPWCFTTDRNKRWEYCDIPICTPVEGGYGNWTLKNACNVTCGEGFETWTRACDNPEPKFNGRNCSHYGEPVEYRSCSAGPCPVNGGYSNWVVSIPCNVSCGEGVEIWKRTCDKPEPKYGGSNCSDLGSSTESRKCDRKPCPIDGNYSNWTKASPCSTTCGGGVEVWIRQCNNPPGKYGGNCGKQGADQENRSCMKQPCPAVLDSESIGLIVAVVLFALIIAVVILIFFLRKRWRKRGSLHHYAIFHFSSRHFSEQHSKDNNPDEMTSFSQGNGTSPKYANLTSENRPIPGLSRGVVLCRPDYTNIQPSRSCLYDRLRVFRPMTIQWLRNAWGNVDEHGHDVYDVMQHNVRQPFVSYDKLGDAAQVYLTRGEGDRVYNRLAQDSFTGSTTAASSSIYNTLERHSPVVLPKGPGKALAT